MFESQVPERTEPADDHVLPEPGGWDDPLTGVTGPRYWDHILANEAARMRRYKRPATIALVEFVGFDEAGPWLGREAALQFFARLAAVVAKTVRSSDHLARIGRTRFGIVLVETDEIRAINFIHRLRDACRKDLGSGSQFGVRIGWASPQPADGFEAALAAAKERLADDSLQEL